jgi:hypothetical protein
MLFELSATIERASALQRTGPFLNLKILNVENFIRNHSELHIFLFYLNKDQRSTNMGKNTYVALAYSTNRHNSVRVLFDLILNLCYESYTFEHE